MSRSFLKPYEEQRRLMAESQNLHDEIRSEAMKTMAIIDRLLIILDEHQYRREQERNRLRM